MNSDSEARAGEGFGTIGEKVASFEIHRLKLIDEDGHAQGPLPDFAADRDQVAGLYRGMHLTRAFDAKAISLQRTGRLGTYASSLGEEAAAVGAAAAMRPDDVLVPSYREHGAQLWRGVTMKELLLYWGGDERGNDFSGPRGDFPVSIPVASQTLHAAGAGLAAKLDGGDRCIVCVCGDGATSKGDFYEAINLAGVWRLPVVFLVCNNQWAISVPLSAQTGARTLAQKAVAAGIGGVQIDGNDVIAVRWAVEQALAKARAGAGAMLVEALTYRLGDHTTADDANRYRDKSIVERHWRAEPISRTRAFLAQRFSWNDDDERALVTKCAEEVEAASEAYLAIPPEPPEAMFDTLFAVLPRPLAAQRASLRGAGEPKND